MPARREQRLVDAATRARDADPIPIDAGLRHEPRIRRIHVTRPLLLDRRLLLLKRREAFPFALAEAAEVERQDVKPPCRRGRCQPVHALRSRLH